MILYFDSKAHQAKERQRKAADAPARALRLTPELVQMWTAVIRDASERFVPGARTCAYPPWSAALAEAGKANGLVAESTASRFSDILWDVADPAWPESRRDLIAFALAVLEADPKLFRSGYAQKYLIKRLQQAPLMPEDIARIDTMLRRAVTHGSGFEEYGAWCKLAGHLVDDGHLPELPGWLAAKADGALITSMMMDGWHWQRVWALPEEDQMRLLRGAWFRLDANGVLWPDLDTQVPVADRAKAPDQREKRNAWRMLSQILRRSPQVLVNSSAK